MARPMIVRNASRGPMPAEVLQESLIGQRIRLPGHFDQAVVEQLPWYSILGVNRFTPGGNNRVEEVTWSRVWRPNMVSTRRTHTRRCIDKMT